MSVVSTPSFLDDPEAALASYWELGYHLEHSLWSDAEIDRLVGASEELPSFRDGTCAPCMHPHRISSIFLEALCNPRIVSIVERLVSGRVDGIQTELFFCKPGTHGFAMHQDNHYVEARPDAFASAWTALQDVTVENGCLVVYPGTHREPILPTELVPVPVDHRGQDPNAHKQQAVLPPGYRGVDVPVPKGGTVFLHAHIVHSSHQNRSQGFRRALLATYVRQGESFRPGNHAKRAPVNVYRA